MKGSATSFRLSVAIAASLATASVASGQEPANSHDPPATGTTADSTSPVADDSRPVAEPGMIHIVPPNPGFGGLLHGKVEIQTLIIHPWITAVDFLLDGNFAARATKRPYTGQVQLANPPREQTLEVRGYDGMGDLLGTDRIILNQPDVPFRVRIVSMRRVQAGEYEALRAAADVSVPRDAKLERVVFYRGERPVEAVHEFGHDAAPGAPHTIAVEALMEYTATDDFVRVTATLEGGREVEDAQLLQGAEYQDEIDIQLVQLQLLITDRDGNPVSGLRQEDFEIREDGGGRSVENLYTASDVPLVLGLAIDTSDSMRPIWSQLQDVSAGFLEAALSPGDRAFLVDFAGTIGLAQEPTGDKQVLKNRVKLLLPRLGTALNDGILFSLLQYRNEPGRRALIVITDGVDIHSRSTPEKSADFAERLGLPIYFIELDRPSGRARSRNGGQLHVERELARRRHRKRLDLISRQTGGRLYYVDLFADNPPWTQRIQRVFEQIEEDLRHQHVLTYYSDQPFGAPVEPEIKVTRRGLKLRSAVPLTAIE